MSVGFKPRAMPSLAAEEFAATLAGGNPVKTFLLESQHYFYPGVLLRQMGPKGYTDDKDKIN